MNSTNIVFKSSDDDVIVSLFLPSVTSSEYFLSMLNFFVKKINDNNINELLNNQRKDWEYIVSKLVSSILSEFDAQFIYKLPNENLHVDFNVEIKAQHSYFNLNQSLDSVINISFESKNEKDICFSGDFSSLQNFVDVKFFLIPFIEKIEKNVKKCGLSNNVELQLYAELISKFIPKGSDKIIKISRNLLGVKIE